MKPFRFILITLMLTVPSLVLAHVGHKKEDAPAPVKQPVMDHSMDHSMPAEEPAGDSFYGGGETGEGNMYGMSGTSEDNAPSLSGTSLMDEAMDSMPMNSQAPMPGMEGSHGKQMESGMQHEQHVEPSEHRRVDSSSKGYGAAVGITALSGLVFLAMCAIKPFEKN